MKKKIAAPRYNEVALTDVELPQPATLTVAELIDRYPNNDILHCSTKRDTKDYEVLEWPQGLYVKDKLSGGDTMAREYLGRLGHFPSLEQARAFIRRRKEAIVAARNGGADIDTVVDAGEVKLLTAA